MALAIENIDTVEARIPKQAVWLDGSESRGTSISVRGYRFEAFAAPDPLAVDALVLMLFLDGRDAMHCEIDGVDHEAITAPGELCILPWHLAMRGRWRSPLEVLKLIVKPSYLESVAREASTTGTRLRAAPAFCVRDAELESLCWQLAREVTPPQPFGSDRGARAVADRVTLHLLRNYLKLEEEETRERVLTESERRALQMYCEAHLDERLTVARLGRVLGLGVHQFARVMRATFATSPQAWLRDLRLARARRLLSSETTSIATIAEACGFADQSHLTRAFRERYGMTPATARRGGVSGPT